MRGWAAGRDLGVEEFSHHPDFHGEVIAGRERLREETGLATAEEARELHVMEHAAGKH